MDPLDELSDLLPDGAVSTHPGELGARSRDWWPFAMLREARGERLDRPLAVAFPRSTEHVASVLQWARRTGTPIVPRGGGSGVVGGAQPLRRSVVLDMSEMHEVLGVDEESQSVEVQAGIRGDRLEAALGDRGLTLGHYPQSLAISSVGGWIAARSAGQASAGYGNIEDLVLGLVAVLATGEVLRLRAVPRSAAGPDLRQLFVGSEGTLGVVAEATLSASRLPGRMRWLAIAPRSFEEGMVLAREVVQRDLRSMVVRLFDPPDAGLSFAEIGHPGGCVLLLGFAEARGPDADSAGQVAADLGAAALESRYGEHWWAHRFDAVEQYRRIMGETRSLGSGVVVDTMEVAALWSRLPDLYSSVGAALGRHSEAVGCHLSHPYRSGASLYFTFMVRRSDDEAAGEAYLRCWRDAVRACHQAAGTVTHHHGVGLLKAPFMSEELGATGLAALRAVKAALDPAGLLNPGKLIPGGG